MRKIKKVVDINAHIENIECKVGRDGDFSNAVISFHNLGYGTITAVKFNAQGYNSFGDTVQINGNNKFFLIIQDICIPPNTRAEDLKSTMPSGDIRKLELEECQICYSDGTVSTYSGKDIREFTINEFDEQEDYKEVLAAIRDELGDKVKCLPQEVDYGWVCGCGRYNGTESNICSNCSNAKDEVFKITDEENIAILINEYRKREEERKEQAEQDKIQKIKERKKKNKIKTLIAVLGIALLPLIGRAVILAGRTTYASEAAMKAALQGTYTYYISPGEAFKQIVISGDKAIYKWNSDKISDMETTVREWNYKDGTIYTFEDLIVTNDGCLKSEDYVFEKGGYMSSRTSYSNTYSSSYSNSSSYESAYSVLVFSDINVSNNSSYTVCTGSIKNIGEKTYRYVKIKGAFKDFSGNVIDTDWTYAVGSEGLAPGEASTFRMSVDKNTKISSCSLSIIDYD